ncbi:MAG: glycosyltransferase family 4 protein [Actinomycetales bacterium]
MRILHLSWEYPPVIYGGLGRHVHALTRTQADLGHDVAVLTQAAEGLPSDEIVDGVRVIRIPNDAPYVSLDEGHLIDWVMGFNSGLSRAGVQVFRGWQPEVVHGHDWLVAHAGVLLRDALDVPYVSTMHATEAGRHQGWLPSELSKSIHGIEWWSCRQAARVICCSAHMRSEVHRLFETPQDRIDVIPNGIDPQGWQMSGQQRREARERNPGPLVVFTGRLEWEKGVHTLIDALPSVRRAVPGARIVLAGRGSAEQRLRDQVRAKRLGRQVTFAGWMPQDALRALVAAADAVVVPSIYEPFGIVALEAAVLGAPLVVARTGGLTEIVSDGRTGWTFEPGNAADLAAALTDALTHPQRARSRARFARQRVERDFGWAVIAQRTEAAYRDAQRREVAERVGPTRPILRPGNLFTGALA